jgi:hypothetical protein
MNENAVELPERAQADRTDKKIVSKGLNLHIFLKLIGYCCTFILLIIVIKVELDLYISFLPILFLQFLLLILLAIIKKQTKDSLVTFLLVENTLDLLFYICIIFVVIADLDCLIILAIPSFQFIITIFTASYQIKKLAFPIFMVNNSVFFLCILFCMIRVKGLINWKLYICFWPLYVLYCLLLVMNIIFSKHIFSSLKSWSMRVINFREVLFINFLPILSIVFSFSHTFAIVLLGCILILLKLLNIRL